MPNLVAKMMLPTKQKFLKLLFLFLLLSLSSLFIFSLSPSDPINNPQFHQIQNPNPNFTFIIKLLTFNRLSSLSRCLNSLAKATYDPGDQVHLHVYIDHFPLNGGSGDLDRDLNVSRQIVDFVDGFRWRFGQKVVHYRTSNAGLQAQWLESWWPASDHEFAFVVEDDLELSPLYYRFLKGVIMNYYYNATNYSPSIYGASLQRPRFVAGKHGNKMKLDGSAQIFLYQLVGTWGQLLFPKPWKEFRLWYDMHKAKGLKPFLDGMVTTGWYKRIGEKIWTPWFIKFIQSRGYFNIYTNFNHERALSISHRDAGVNYGKTAGPDSYLLDGNSKDFNSLELYPLNDLKWYDFCFREVVPNRIVEFTDEIESVIQSVQKKNSIVLVSLYRVPEAVVRNMLCQFERLNIQNYILIGPTSDFVLDLARRGHPVVDGGRIPEKNHQLADTIHHQGSAVELSIEITLMALAVGKSLKLGYNTWLLDGNMLPRSNDSFFDSFDRKSDFYISKTARLLFVRSSSSSLKIWTEDYMYKVSLLVDKLRDSVSHEYILFDAVGKLLEKQSIKFSNVDETPLCLNIGGGHANPIALQKETKFVFWSYATGFDLIQRQLLQLNMWGVDGDMSCTAVVCHPS